MRHPGGALGFRLSPSGAPERSLVFIPDNEMDRFGDQAPGAPTRKELMRFAHGARVLIHDAMYTGAEYMDHRGWGHSSYRDAVDFAIAAEVETLVLFHHDPERSDAALVAQLALCREMVAERNGKVEVIAAAEGMEIWTSSCELIAACCCSGCGLALGTNRSTQWQLQEGAISTQLRSPTLPRQAS